MKNDSLKLDMFFPDELLSTTSVNHDDNSIHIKMRSKTHSSKCREWSGNQNLSWDIFTQGSRFTDSWKNCTTSYNSS